MSNPNHENDENDDEDLLTLSLSSNSRKRSATPSLPTKQIFMRAPCTPSNINNINNTIPANSNSKPRRRRRRRSASEEKSETIPPPFPWATDRRATVHNLSYLLENRILAIKGKVECKSCKNKFEMVIDLRNNLSQLLNFIDKEKKNMHERAPKVWMRPVLLKCDRCGQDNSVQPSFENTKKKNINWLFLLLSQMIGCCTLAQLKYFLKHNNIHRTGAKERVLYYSYICLCNQLKPYLLTPILHRNTT
ncbi:hypothetical protein VNO80_29019 [Phaseolus coccineus]|uniref:DUF7086 domain-containing protein n=1 Tax=Phaseolus coccineus TaxID=3886 RepID=A0AAN9QEI3_PHACN